MISWCAALEQAREVPPAAWQMIHRVARVRFGGIALVTGAAGGVGTAALQLLRLAGVKTYGAASAPKHDILRALGAIPINYRAGPVDRLTRALGRTASITYSMQSGERISANVSARYAAAERWWDLVLWVRRD
ncbi:MAG TPA: hypothetical protein VGG72_29705 [Bryobacteraceae bacterium]|jgi:NADPH:quinone reductase-like Zn-dependent oxidoreductase